MSSAIIISAPQSGSGKTTVALGLMAAFRRRGMRVAPFKTGPDFIDPGYHRLVTGRPSVNLDGWICPPDFVSTTFSHHCRAADIAIIEGAMGLFDGLGSSRQGSTAQIAHITGAPVILVVNARGISSSVAPLVSGFAQFDPGVRIAGVIFNNVGSGRHAEILSDALKEHCPQVAFLGAIPRDEQLVIPSRHLGLVTADDNPLEQAFIDRLANNVESCLDMEGIIRCSAMPEADTCHCNEAPADGRVSVKLAIASDQAFCFVYEDNLRLLKEAGAELIPFSPLCDRSLPEGTMGVYLPGGYPELYRSQLSDNRPMLDSIRSAVSAGLPVYAECGGLLYLSEGVAEHGQDQPACRFGGIFPVVARMGERRAALGYREVRLMRKTILGVPGDTLRGHEFHYSFLEGMPEETGRAFQVSRPGGEGLAEGFVVGRCLASYVHLHLGSFPSAAASFVEACRVAA